MIYTNNINEFSEKLENKLNETLGTTTHKIFKVYPKEQVKRNTNDSDGLLEIQSLWCLSIGELNEIKAILESSFFVSEGKENNSLTIWTTYKIEDK